MSRTVRARLAGARSALVVLAAIGARPSLWATAVRQGSALRSPGGLRPAPDYLAFRLTTQYGDPHHPAEAGDVVSYLRWCRQWRTITG